MIEKEGLPDHDYGAILNGEERFIVAGVEELLKSVPFAPDYMMPEPPSTLVRRFWLAYDETDEITGPWRDLPGDLVQRVHLADICARDAVTVTSLAYDEETRVTALAPEAVHDIYRQAIAEHSLCEEQFDLHDVYVCAEAMYLRAHDRWQTSGASYEYTALPAIRAALDAIGHALAVDAGPGANR